MGVLALVLVLVIKQSIGSKPVKTVQASVARSVTTPSVSPPAPPATPSVAVKPTVSPAALPVAALEKVSFYEPALPPWGLSVAQLTADLREDPSSKFQYVGRMLLVQGIVDQTPPGGVILTNGLPSQSVACRFLELPAFQALIGGSVQIPEQPSVVPGQSAAVQGVFNREGHLERCEIVSTLAPADRSWRGKPLQIEGMVQTIVPPKEAGAPTLLVLETPTDSRVKVEWAFKPSDASVLATLLPGQMARIRGTCGSRFQTTLRINDCQLIPPEAPDEPAVRKTTLPQLCQAYQQDLVALQPPAVEGTPVTVASQHLVEAFQENPREAIRRYWGMPLVVAGIVAERRDAESMVFLESPTGSRYRLAAHFTPSQYKLLGTLTQLQLRCTVSEVVNNQILRLENCSAVDPEGTNVAKTSAEYLPLKSGTELSYFIIQHGTGKDHPIRLITMKFSDSQTFQVVQAKLGTYFGKSLFQPKLGAMVWSNDPRHSGVPLFTLKYRQQYDTIEIGRPTKPQPGDKDIYWEPILKLGRKAGDSWKAIDPDGKEVTYTVQGFRQDRKDRDIVDIKRVSILPNDPNAPREESIIAFARGVGEVGRSVTMHAGANLPVLIREDKLLEPGDFGEGRLESARPGQ